MSDGEFVGIPLGKVGLNLAQSHLDQLHSSKSLIGARPKPPKAPKASLEQLKEWTQANSQHIKNAVAKGAFGGGSKRIDWEIVFFTFMESAATYLRDETKLAKAIELYNPGAADFASENREALKLYFDCTADIRTLAKLWGLDYVMICDLPDKNKSGNLFIGPYCGCFYSPGTNPVPLMSIAFKGTNFADIGEGIVDFVYDTFQAPADRLFGTNISTGVYDSLFSKFEIGTTTISPFELIEQTLLSVKASMQPSKDAAIAGPVVPTVHVTGHSLGASYACFCFAQLLIQFQSANRNSSRLGDIYTFGCPRVGHSDWAEALFGAMTVHEGTSVRVVNEKDIVPQIVPVVFRDWPPYFNHIDAGQNIFPNKAPKDIPTERGTAPPGMDWVWNWDADAEDHQTPSYYASLVNAMKAK